MHYTSKNLLSFWKAISDSGKGFDVSHKRKLQTTWQRGLTVTGGDNYGNNSLMSEVNDVMSKPISCVLTPLSIMPRCSPSFFLSRLVLCVYHNIQVCCGKLITCHIDSYHIQLKSMIIPLLYFNLLLQIMLHLFFFIFEVECRRTR